MAISITFFFSFLQNKTIRDIDRVLLPPLLYLYQDVVRLHSIDFFVSKTFDTRTFRPFGISVGGCPMKNSILSHLLEARFYYRLRSLYHFFFFFFIKRKTNKVQQKIELYINPSVCYLQFFFVSVDKLKFGFWKNKRPYRSVLKIFLDLIFN